MPPNKDKIGSPQEWLLFAKSDLAFAGVHLPPGGLYAQLCFHAQQAVEKSMKAVLLHFGISFPYTHSLQGLLDLLPKQVIIPELYGAVDLTPYAVSSRYPRMIEPATEDDYHNALSIAEAVVAWAEAIIHQKEPTQGE